ncbi:MAG: tetrahydromethanopterin S-methyltransferase subunit H [Thermodesulfobacteriota bacterium]
MEIKNVGGVNMGGEPGECPTLLIGSIFYDRQKLVLDPAEGEFDEEAALALLTLQGRWSEKTGNPAGLDVIASTPQAMRRYLDFVTAHFQGPILVDGSDAKVKVAGVEHLAAKGLVHLAVYNSLTPESREYEYQALEACGVKAAVLLPVQAQDFTVEAKFKILTGSDGLMSLAGRRGVEHRLVDPGVIDLPSVGLAKEVFSLVRAQDCLVGAAPHNAIGTWGGLTEKFGQDFKLTATAVLNALPPAWGADFVIYGPLTLASTVFPAVAMVNAIMAQTLLEKGRFPGPEHPLFKIA